MKKLVTAGAVLLATLTLAACSSSSSSSSSKTKVTTSHLRKKKLELLNQSLTKLNYLKLTVLPFQT